MFVHRFQRRIRKILFEKGTEPLQLLKPCGGNCCCPIRKLSAGTKVKFDLIGRLPYAFSLLFAADQGKNDMGEIRNCNRIRRRRRNGLLNLCHLAERNDRSSVRVPGRGLTTTAGRKTQSSPNTGGSCSSRATFRWT